MTAESQIARDVSYQFECKKDAFKQNQDGTVKVTLSIHPDEVPWQLMKDAMGQRFVCVMVPLGDDDTPRIPEPKKERKWSDLKPQAQASMLVTKDDFPYTKDELKEHLGIKSLTYLDPENDIHYPPALREFEAIARDYFAAQELQQRYGEMS